MTFDELKPYPTMPVIWGDYTFTLHGPIDPSDFPDYSLPEGILELYVVSHVGGKGIEPLVQPIIILRADLVDDMSLEDVREARIRHATQALRRYLDSRKEP